MSTKFAFARYLERQFDGFKQNQRLNNNEDMAFPIKLNNRDCKLVEFGSDFVKLTGWDADLVTIVPFGYIYSVSLKEYRDNA